MTDDKFRLTTLGGVLGLIQHVGRQQRRFVDPRKDVSGVFRLKRIRLDRRALISTGTSALAPPENESDRSGWKFCSGRCSDQVKLSPSQIEGLRVFRLNFLIKDRNERDRVET